MTNLHSKRHRFRRAALLTAVFGLFALMGGFAALIAIPAVNKGNHRIDGEGSRTQPRSHDVSGAGPKAAIPDSSPSSDQRGLGYEDQVEHSPPTEARLSQDHGVVHVRCISPAGLPEVVTLACVITSRSPGKGSAEVVAQWERNTDLNGELTLDSLRVHRAALRVVSDKWYADEVDVPFSSTDMVLIVLSPASTVRIRALYDDGQPVTYMGSLRALDAKRQWTFACGEDGSASVPHVATDAPIRCKVFGQKRPGYFSYTVEFTPAQLASGDELLITVPRSTKPFGTIRLEFENGPIEHSGEVDLEGRSLGPTSYPFQAGQSVIEIWPLPAGDEFRATILGEMAWRSEWVTVNAGDVLVLKVRLSKSGSVRARLLGDDSRPLPGGTLRLSNGDYLHYRAGKSPVAAAPQSDGGGEIVLRGVPVGRIPIEMEAWGKEPVSRDVEVKAGETTDLGDVVLSDAIGEITVQLSGAKEGVRYAIFLGRPGNGGSIYPYVPIPGDRQTLTRLPLRGWVVSVTLAKGGSVESQEVQLTLRDPSALVTLDVSGIEP